MILNRRTPVARIAGALAAMSLLAPVALGAGQAAAAHARPVASGHGGTLVISISGEPDTLDNAHTTDGISEFVFSFIYSTLITQVSATSFSGQIASSWTVSPNGLVYTFHIRQGLQFSNGDPLDAAAVAATFNRILSPATKSPDAGTLGPIKTVTTSGPSTVVVTLSHPFAYELADLAQPYAGIEDPVAVRKEGAQYGRQPVGAGPFMLKSWVSGEAITLVPNPHYHSYAPFDTNKGAPYLSALKFDIISNPETQIAAMQSGETNMIQVLPSANYAQFKHATQFHLDLVPQFDVNFLEFKTTAGPNNTKVFLPPFNDVRVRKAVGDAVDPAALIAAANQGLGTPDYGMVPVGEDAYDPALRTVGFGYNPKAAAQLLTAAGWIPGAGGVRYKDGKPLDVVFWVPTLGTWPQNAQLIASELDAVGFSVKIQALPINSLIAQYPKGSFNMDGLGLGWPNASLLNIALTLPTGSSTYATPYMASLLTKAESETDVAARVALYDQVQAYQRQYAYAVPLYSDNEVIMWANSVHGVVVGYDSSLDFTDTTVGG